MWENKKKFTLDEFVRYYGCKEVYISNNPLTAAKQWCKQKNIRCSVVGNNIIIDFGKEENQKDILRNIICGHNPDTGTPNRRIREEHLVPAARVIKYGMYQQMTQGRCDLEKIAKIVGIDDELLQQVMSDITKNTSLWHDNKWWIEKEDYDKLRGAV